MIYKKGKWQASYKDTWCLEETLRPIIGAAVKKFIETERNGCPVDMLEEIGCKDWHNNTREESNKAQELWESILQKIDFSFNSKEPNIDDYNFNTKFVPGVTEDGLVATEVIITNEDELSRYQEALREYEEKKQEGYELFGKYLVSLWS